MGTDVHVTMAAINEHRFFCVLADPVVYVMPEFCTCAAPWELECTFCLILNMRRSPRDCPVVGRHWRLSHVYVFLQYSILLTNILSFS